MEDNYLVVVVAALQDPENGITLQTELKKKRERKVFDGGQIISALNGFGLNDKAKNIEIGQRLLDIGMIKSSSGAGEEFAPGKNYTFGDRILMDRQYIIDQLPTAIAYFAQNPYRRPASAKSQERGRSIFSRLKNLIDREEPPADPTATPTDDGLAGEAVMQVYNPALSLQSVSALDPDLIEEDTDEIIFMISSDDPFPLVKAATIQKLVERLTFEKFIDIRFQSKFLLTFRAFMTPATLFEGLLRRFRGPENVILNRAQEDEHEYQKRKKVIQLRVITVVSRWVQDYYEDFLDPQQRARLVSFIEQDVAAPFPPVATNMKQALQQRQEQWERRRKPLTESILASAAANFNPDNLAIAELAVQLTIYDFDLFASITPTQWVHFSRGNKETQSRNILRSIANFNRISKWVAADILKRIQVKARAVALSRFINLAMRLRDMYSYNMAMAVFSALNSAPIRRLAATWTETAPDTKFRELEEVFAYTHSYKAYRAALRKSPAPCIPYLGLYLTELTFIEEANPAEIYGLVNFQKHVNVARVVDEVQFYQQFPYRQAPDPSALAWLQVGQMASLTDEECWQLSLRVEPRNAMESLEKVLMEEERLRQQLKVLELRVSDLEKENAGLKQQINTLDANLRSNLRLTSGGSSLPRPPRGTQPGSPAGSIRRPSLAGRVAPKVQDSLRGTHGRKPGPPRHSMLTNSGNHPANPPPQQQTDSPGLPPLTEKDPPPPPPPTENRPLRLSSSGRGPSPIPSSPAPVPFRAPSMVPSSTSGEVASTVASAPSPAATAASPGPATVLTNSATRKSPRNSGIVIPPAVPVAARDRPPSPLPFLPPPPPPLTSTSPSTRTPGSPRQNALPLTPVTPPAPPPSRVNSWRSSGQLLLKVSGKLEILPLPAPPPDSPRSKGQQK